MALSCDVIVVGGGIVGSAIGAALAELDISTVLIERGCVGGEGASRYSGGIIRLYDPDLRLMELAGYSFARMQDTRCGAAFASTVRRTGVHFALDGDPAPDALDVARSHEAAAGRVEVLSREEAAEAGAVMRPDGPGPVLREKDGGYGDVRASARMLIQQLRRTGVVLENAAAQLDGLSGDAVTLRVGDSHVRGRRLVVAAGSYSGDLIADLPLEVRSIPMLRMITRRPVRSPVIDAACASYMVPVGEGVVQVGSRARSQARRPEGLTFDPDAIAADARQRIEAMTGEAGFGSPLDIVRGYDVYGEDGPMIGHLPGRDLYVATGFSGVGYKLAVGAGWLVARQIAASLSTGCRLSENEHRLLGLFDPARHGRGASPAGAHQE